jgi:hypothetical protein
VAGAAEAMSLWQFAATVDGFNRARDPDAPEPLTPAEEDARAVLAAAPDRLVGSPVEGGGEDDGRGRDRLEAGHGVGDLEALQEETGLGPLDLLHRLHRGGNFRFADIRSRAAARTTVAVAIASRQGMASRGATRAAASVTPSWRWSAAGSA